MTTRSKKLMILVATLMLVCLFLVSISPTSAFANASPHTAKAMHDSRHGSGPNVSGGGCGKVYTIVDLYACVSDNGNDIIPDAYISPGRTNYSAYSNCLLNIYLYDITAGSKTSAINLNCTSPLTRDYQGHFYGKSVSPASGHTYYTQTIATYKYQGVPYTTVQTSPNLAA